MEKKRARLGSLAACAFAACGLFASSARSDAGRDALLFSITKTENRNFVQFALHVDARCAPAGDSPVHAWWRMLEHGLDATEPLLSREQPAYGIASQQVIARRDDGGEVRVALRALSDRPLVVESRRAANGACEAFARTSIDGRDARLYNVHAVLAWPFGVSKLLLSGWEMGSNKIVREDRRP